MKNKTSILIMILCSIFITGCAIGNINNYQEYKKDVSKDLDKDIKRYKTMNIDTFTFSLNSGDSLNDIIKKVKKGLPNLNLMITENVYLNSKYQGISNIKNITFKQYLEMINEYYGNEEVYSFKRKGNIYILDIEKNQKFIKENYETLQEKQTEKNIKLFKQWNFKATKETTVGELFLILKEQYPSLSIIYNISNYEEFVNSTIGINFIGNVVDLAKHLKSKFGYSVDFSSGIEFYELKQKTFKLDVPPLASTGNSGSDIYDALKENAMLKTMNEKTTVEVSKQRNELVIKGDLEDIQRIKEVVKDFNKDYSKQVDIEVIFYTVEHNKANNINVDTTGLVNSLIDKGLGYTFGNKKTYSSLVGQVFSNGEDSLNSLKIFDSKETKMFTIDFLNKYGRAVTLQSPKFTTLNKVPYKLNLKESKDYIKSIKEEYVNSSTTTNNNLTTISTPTLTKEIETEKIDIGFEIEILPEVDQENGLIYVKLKPVITDLIGMQEYTYESGQPNENGDLPKNTIQLLDTKDFNLNDGQIAILNNGETAIIGGYIYKKNGVNYSGITNNEQDLLNYLDSGRNGSEERVEIIIFVTAKVKNMKY